MEKKIAIVEAESYQTDIVCKKIIELFDKMSITKTINEHTKILLKPNLLAKHPPEHAVTTHPEVLRGVIRACIQKGASKDHILVADSAGGIYNPKQMKSLYQGCGLTTVCEEEGVSLYMECQSQVISVPNGRVVSEFEILTPVLEADFIINLPKMKSHVMTGMTAACKNMFGIIPGLKKSEWHMRFPDKERFGQMLIDLLETVPPQLAILDGILAMEGNGPGGGDPREVGILMASEDMLNMDLAIAYMMGLSPKRVPYLRAANQRGLCDDEFQLHYLDDESNLCKPLFEWKLPESYVGDHDGNTDFAALAPNWLKPMAKKVEDMIAPYPKVEEDLCIGCGKCAEICSKDAINIKNKKAKIRKKDCIRCFCCHEMCPVKAIEVKKMKFFGL